MTTVSATAAILTLLAGIGIFLVACQMMSSNLESVSSNRLKALFSKASNNKLLGVGIGTVATAAIQSSGATTVMVIGFVNAGIISLMQAATIIYGANIGTTITAQIVALGMFGKSALSTSVVFSAFAGIGIFISLLAKKDLWKKIGGILAGFGMLFVGLSLMSSSMADFAQADGVKRFLASIGNPILLVVIGAVFTAIIQSSSVTTSIAIAMVVSGLINLDQGIFLTMGSNIGSCVVAIIAGMTSGKNAKRTALIHLIFNCSGVIFFMVVNYLLEIFSGGEFSFGPLFNKMFPDVPQTQLAMFHTIFNVTTVILLLPLTNFLVNLVCRIIPDNADAEINEAMRLQCIDLNMLSTPPIAVQQTKAEIIRMAGVAMENLDRALDMITKLDFSQMEKFKRHEAELNYLNTALVDVVVKINERNRLINEHDRKYLVTTFRSIRDLERIGDYAENIVEYAEALRDAGQKFSPQAISEIAQLRSLTHNLYHCALDAYQNEDHASFKQAEAVEDHIDDFTKDMETNHIERLNEGICTATVGAQYLSLASNMERIADHLMNVGKTIESL